MAFELPKLDYAYEMHEQWKYTIANTTTLM